MVGLFFCLSGAWQRRQLASERTPLTPFAPAPSTVSCVPLTRNLSPADTYPLPLSGGGQASQRQLPPLPDRSLRSNEELTKL